MRNRREKPEVQAMSAAPFTREGPRKVTDTALLSGELLDLDAIERQFKSASEMQHSQLYNGAWAFARETTPALIAEVRGERKRRALISKNLYEIARFVGIPGEAAARLKGVLDLLEGPR